MDRRLERLQSVVNRIESSIKRLDNDALYSDRRRRPGSNSINIPWTAVAQRDLHFTGAHHLTKSWPAIKNMLGTVGIDLNENYVLDAEDGSSTCRENRAVPLGSYSAYSRAITAEGFDNGSVDYYQVRPSNEYIGAGSLSYHAIYWPSEDVRNSLLRSYVKHMWILHPFLDLEHVERLFNKLTSHLVRQEQIMFREHVGAAGPPTPLQGVEIEDSTGEVTALEKALILLILSLGSVCNEKAGTSLNRCTTSRLHGNGSSPSSAASSFSGSVPSSTAPNFNVSPLTTPTEYCG